jgi:4'-phosphopantetheinyl transferase
MEPEHPPSDDADEVHIWKINLNDAGWDAFAGTLSADEHARAARFHGVVLQQNFRRCRGALRRILSSYSRWRPEEIRFRYGEFGKPELDAPGLQFNLSHSRSLAVVGISEHRLGIDIEYRKEFPELGGLIKLVCNTAEKNELYELPPTEQRERFYRIWVRKEAFCKAVGMGLQSGLKDVDIDMQGRIAYRGFSRRGIFHEQMFHLHDLEIAEGYSASLCTVVATPRISSFSAKPDIF